MPRDFPKVNKPDHDPTSPSLRPQPIELPEHLLSRLSSVHQNNYQEKKRIAQQSRWSNWDPGAKLDARNTTKKSSRTARTDSSQSGEIPKTNPSPSTNPKTTKPKRKLDPSDTSRKQAKHKERWKTRRFARR